MKIIETDWGIAYQYDDIIEINPILYKYPELLAMMTKHEFNHQTGSILDPWYDLKELFRFDSEYIKFCFRHPILSMQQMMPIWYHNNGWNINYFLCILYCIILVIIVIVLKFI